MNPMCYNLESPLSNRQVSPCLLIGPRILAQNHVKSQSSMPDSWFYWLYRHSRCVHTYIHIYMYIYIYIYTYIFSVLEPLSHGMSWAIPCNSPCGSMSYGPFHSTAHVLREIRPIFQGLVNVRHLNIPDPSIGDFSSPETFSGFS